MGMSNATKYRVRVDATCYLRTAGAGYSWVGKARQGMRFTGRAAAEAAAREVETIIAQRCGKSPTLQIVPASGGTEITRR
jgi:hypothetical protein